VDGAVQNQYQVDGIPTLFILDANGVIVAHLVGLRDEEELLHALKKAGLKTRS
jgi:cytochrome oxidase Cu insertion factor (SCO1/SenC/PrrC family)